MSFQEIYNNLRQKQQLPEFEVLNRYFQIASIDEDEAFPLLAIAKKINEKIQKYSELLENIVSPDHSFATLVESKVFTEQDKTEILEHFKKLQIMLHDSELAGIEFDEESISGFISSVIKEWPGLSDRMRKVILKLRSSWTEKSSFSEEISYFG
jgi:hypothetical protein